MNHLEQALAFRNAMRQSHGCLTQPIISLQTSLIAEECDELMESARLLAFNMANKRCREETLKELTDLTYVCYQMAAAAGWDLDEALDRVHESNMTKLVDGEPVKDENGKVVKGPNYKAPSLVDLV